MFKHLHLSKIDACMAVVILCVMIDLLGLSLSIPILANYARDVQGNAPGCPLAGGSNNNNTAYMEQFNSPQCQLSVASIKANTGYLTTAYSFSMLISTFWMPVFSDKFGPRKAIIVSIFGSILGFLGQSLTCPTLESNPNSTCVGIPGGFGMLVAVRALGGLFGGTATVAAAFIVILYPQKKRGQQFAKMSACALSAFVFGPFAGGGLAQFGLRVPLYCAAGLSFLAMLLAFRFVLDPNELLKLEKKSNGTRRRSRSGSGSGSPSQQNKKPRASSLIDSTFVPPADDFLPWKEIRVWLISFQTMFTTLAFNGLSSLIALVLLEERLGVVTATDTVEMQGKKVALWIMAYVPTLGATQVFIVMGLFPKMVKRIGLLQTGAIGSVFIAIALFLIPFYTHPAMVFITQILLALGNGLQTNVSNTYLSKFAPKGKAAKTLSYGSMADTIGNIIGPQLTQIYLVDARWPFYIAAIFGLCSAIILTVLIMLGANAHPDHATAVEQKKKDTKNIADLTKNPLITKEQSGQSSAGSAGTSISVTSSTKEDGGDDVEMNLLKQQLLTEQDQMDAMPIEQRIHPACFHTGEITQPHHLKYSTEAMSELSEFMYDELLDKQHMWGLRSGNLQIRQRSLEAHKDMLRMSIRRIPPPSDEDGDKSFREGVAVFLSETGHDDWAMLIPGIDLDSVLETFRVPH